jgi:hypothetical protein
MGRIIPYIMENKKCSKPPTRNTLYRYVCTCGCVFGIIFEDGIKSDGLSSLSD